LLHREKLVERVAKSQTISKFALAGAIWILSTTPSFAQQPVAAQPVDREESYYRFSVGHLYHRLAMQHALPEYVDRAIAEYQAAMAADPASTYIPQELIQLYASVNRLEDAVKLGNEVAARSPRDAEVRRLLGQIYQSYAYDRRGGFNRESAANAVAEFEKALEIEPDDLETLQALGGLKLDLGDAAAAEKHFLRALEVAPADSQALAGLARIYIASGETQKAIDALEQVVQSEGGNRRSLESLARAYEEVRRFAEAADIYRRLMEDAGSNGGNQIAYRGMYADSLLRARDYAKAREQYERLAEIQPRNAIHRLRLAQIDTEDRRFEQAWGHIQEAQRLDPENLDVKYNIVLLLEAELRYNEAAEGMRQILDDTKQESYDPADLANRIRFLGHLASIERQREDFEAARGIYSEMAVLDPNFAPQSRALTIDTFRAEKNSDRALEEAARAVREYPENDGLRMQWATILAETGHAGEAAEIVEGLMTGDESDAELYLSLAQLWEKGKDLDKALAAIEEAEKLAPDQKIPILFSKASILERFKKFDESETVFRQLLELDPDNSGALNYLGYMLADQGIKLDEAHDMIQRALDLEPDNGAYLDSLGWVYYRQEKFDLAERQLLRSLERYGRDPVVLTHLGDVYQKLGDVEKAVEHWRQGLEEWRRTPKADQDTAEIERLEEKLTELEK
jgi:tetratricopeptide (TPR) repeat protein